MNRLCISDRFWLNVDMKADDECWEWKSPRPNGYGTFYIRPGESQQAHRWAYEDLVELIPEGLVLDHLCRNKACVNPAHLEPVTQRENVRRGTKGYMRYEREFCKHGHPFAETARITANGRRICGTCKRQWRAA